ncbi:MAG: hypothetical protein KF788_09015 [Piscinibacter sp.]|nr:hypothetical protein [Piscinibacter sp.]
MTATLPLAPRRFPARVADLGFTAVLPADWVSHALPSDAIDFSDPTAFAPLAIVTAPHAAIVFSFAARPAHVDGSLHDWAWYHLQQQPLQPRAVGQDRVAGVAAILGEAAMDSELGPMTVRFAFLEDGDRLVQLSLTAPELFADSVRDAWFEMLRSFTLETPRGSRFVLDPQADAPPAPAGHGPADAGEALDEASREASGEPPPPAVDLAGEPVATADGSDPAAASAEAAPEVEGPAWWREALALEAAGDVAAAEAHIREGCPHIGYACATAELHRTRMRRLMATGDVAGADLAFRRSGEWIRHYAGLATSGGEGAALSLERDAFLAALDHDHRAAAGRR